MGRAKNAVLKVAMEAKSAREWLRFGKKTAGKTSAAAVP
ncbi:Uncharacterised protein [Mycobacteroides abscessus subsp. massiliense]|nr:Uncharacterised protein [Mycobacteroides abscessus subsp. abscessus]SLI42661.1 Uncharacterised protein [Mycobacteroides abscessus subsp. massiliense]